MISFIEPPETSTLGDYEAHAFLNPAVASLRSDAEDLVPKLRGRTVWMVNSTAQGGGVAEMMPRLITLLRELGVDARWMVITPEEPRFFEITKHLHNLIHGAGDPHLGADDRELYRRTSEELARGFRQHLRPDDLLVIHDPQPAAMGAMLKKEVGVQAIWRCHIGLDTENEQTRTAWDFLKDHISAYDRAVFTLQEYAPDYLKAPVEILHPAIDPLGEKNRPLRPHVLSGVLNNAGLAITSHPVLRPAFPTLAQRLQPDGSFAPAALGEDIGLLYRPIVTQISRWDQLKGWAPLLQGFERLKTSRYGPGNNLSDRHRRRLGLVRLVLAGPDPDSIRDDPEALDVFYEICGLWHDLDPDLQRDVAVLSLPMASRRVNALMVNALQRCSTVVVQNSIQEGFGLTVTEAMWKELPVVGSRAAGIRAQVIPDETGSLIPDPNDPIEVAGVLNEILEADAARQEWGLRGQRRVYDNFLIFSQVKRWLEVLVATLDARSG